MNKKDDIIWKPIVGFEGRYSVSNYGDIRSDARMRSGSAPCWMRAVIMTPQLRPDGYCQVRLSKGSRRGYQMVKVHRIVAEAFIPNPDNLPRVNHIDGDKTNNHVSNLEWVSRSDNMLHAYTTGLARQERLWSSKADYRRHQKLMNLACHGTTKSHEANQREGKLCFLPKYNRIQGEP